MAVGQVGSRQYGLFHCSEGREWIPCPVVSAALAPELSSLSEGKSPAQPMSMKIMKPRIVLSKASLLIVMPLNMSGTLPYWKYKAPEECLSLPADDIVMSTYQLNDT